MLCCVVAQVTKEKFQRVFLSSKQLRRNPCKPIHVNYEFVVHVYTLKPLLTAVQQIFVASQTLYSNVSVYLLDVIYSKSEKMNFLCGLN